MTIYDISLKNHQGQVISLNDFKDKVILVVNVPVNSGSTLQLKKLHQLSQNYENTDLKIIAVQTDEFAIKLFGNAESFTFPLTEKTIVRGEGQHPLYKHLTTEAPDSIGTFYSQAKRAFIKRGLDEGSDNDVIWNFEKFIVNKKGEVVKRFATEILADDSRLIEVIDQEIAHTAKRSA